jgi:hypothetical protein
MSEIPWVGLAALLAMFLLPLLPEWWFEGRRTIRHWPRRHVCAVCSAPWTDGHTCETEPAAAPPRPLRGELRRLDAPQAVRRRLAGR